MPIAPFDLVREADEEGSFTKPFVMMPSRWRAFLASGVPTLSWAVERLQDASAPRIPADSGIYAFVVQSEVAPPLASWCMYVGKSNNLAVRFRSYLKERESQTGRPKIVYLLNKWPDHTHFWFARVPLAEISRVEDALIRALTPPGNTEVPADIRGPHAAF